MLPTKGYLDADGVAALWERIRRLVYECAGKNDSVTYTLECEGNVVSLVGSDGSRSTVVVDAIAECELL